MFNSYQITTGKKQVKNYNPVEFIKYMAQLTKSAVKSDKYKKWAKQKGILNPVNTTRVEDKEFKGTSIDILTGYLVSCGWEFKKI